MNKPHKHAAVIKAWADGHVVQMKSKVNGMWEDVKAYYPSWPENYEFRVKPEPPKTHKTKVRLFAYRCNEQIRIGVIEEHELHLIHKESFIRWIDHFWVGIEISA